MKRRKHQLPKMARPVASTRTFAVSAEVATEKMVSAFLAPREVLTDGLVEELVERGWPKADLQDAQLMGFRYNRERDSLCSKPEWIQE